jgi:hypothetical protein
MKVWTFVSITFDRAPLLHIRNRPDISLRDN